MSGSKFGFAKSSSTPPQSPEAMTQAMVTAILKNDAATIATLVSQGANVNSSDIKGNSLLTIAATDPREHGALGALILAKADPNYPSANGRLPLHSVLRMKDGRLVVQAITILLTAKADPNRIEQRTDMAPMSAFQVAYEQNRDDKVFETLIAHGADPSIGEDAAKGIFSPLHGLAATGRYAVLEAAHNAGINIDKQAANGMTCLMIAARGGAVKTIETLLECNADPTVKDNKGNDALTYARSAPDIDWRPLVKMMMRAAKDHVIRRELAQLRAEVDSLRQQIAKSA